MYDYAVYLGFPLSTFNFTGANYTQLTKAHTKHDAMP